jgi:uncharacterized protein YjbJ (UPF0337 family)
MAEPQYQQSSTPWSASPSSTSSGTAVPSSSGGYGQTVSNPSKIHGTYEKMTGGLQHGFGRMIGSTSMAMRGEQRRAYGMTELQGKSGICIIDSLVFLYY